MNKMENEFSIPFATAIFGGIFIQYIIYGFLYIIDGCRLE
jgi:hypothetical protein